MNFGNIVIDERVVKFGLVGIGGMILDFAITWLCKEKWQLNKFVANSCGFVVAVTHNFIWNRHWTFAGTAAQSLGEQFVKFALVSLSGLLLNNLLLYLLLKKTKLNFYFTKLIAIGLVFCWNYLINFLFTFH